MSIISHPLSAHGDLGLALLEALGLQGKHVYEVTIHVPSDALVTVDVKMELDSDQFMKIVREMKRVRFMPVEP